MSKLQAPEECTNRELFLLIDSLKSSFENFVCINTDEHKTVMKKQDHTNGDIKLLKLWRSKIIGALSVLTILISLMPVIIKAMEQ
jgi:hypothetical protein